MESAAELYTMASINRSEVIEAKQGLMAELMVTTNNFSNVFAESKYLEQALNFISEYYAKLFLELNYEHDLYDKIMCYIASFDEPDDLDDEEILSDIASIFDFVEEALEHRLVVYQEFCNHLTDVINSGILTSNNYLFYNYVGKLDEQQQGKLLALVPGDDNYDVYRDVL